MTDASLTAAVLIIGDEVLSGRTQDTNLNTLARFLGALGIDLLEARTVGDRTGQIIEALNALRATHDVIADVRGRGLMVGLELGGGPDADRLGAAVTSRCSALGLHVNIVQLPGMGGTFRIAPPLTTTDAEIDRGLAILDTALGAVAG